MAVRIPSKVLAFALYTLVLLGAAFGISYGVFEWRHDDEAFDASAIEQRIDELEQEPDAGPTQAELDAERCGAALSAAGAAAAGSERSPKFAVPPEVQDAIDRYCK